MRVVSTQIVSVFDKRIRRLSRKLTRDVLLLSRLFYSLPEMNVKERNTK